MNERYVICVANKPINSNLNADLTNELTVGKRYKILTEFPRDYRIVNDGGRYGSYNKSRFTEKELSSLENEIMNIQTMGYKGE